MPIEIHGAEEHRALKKAGAVATATLDAVEAAFRSGAFGPGTPTADIADLVAADTAARGGTPSQLGYHGFPAVVCTSKNEVVCHGIPSRTEVLRDGDIVNVDVTTCIGGAYGDTSRTFCVGRPERIGADARRVVDVARRALLAGIAVVRPGARLGDIGAAIGEAAKKAGCSVVADFGGHGIGRLMHMDPHVSHVGVRGRGLRIVEGMCFTIEPMINLGDADTRVCDDGWRVVTVDGSLSAQFEHTVFVTASGCDVLTRSQLPNPLV